MFCNIYRVFAWTQLTSQTHKITLDDVQYHIYLEGHGWEIQHPSGTAPGVSFFAEFCAAQASCKETSSMLGRLFQSLIPPRANMSCKNNNTGTISKVHTWHVSDKFRHSGKPEVLPHSMYFIHVCSSQSRFNLSLIGIILPKTTLVSNIADMFTLTC